MRIIAGSAKGRRLLVPKGAGVRPTMDKTRAALFSMLAPFAPFERVLDLYAGSGALGLEALSRWGGRATFVDRDPAACIAVGRNAAAAGLESSAAIVRRALPAALSAVPGPFDLVLADPPYASPDVGALMRRLAEPGLVAPDGIAVLEHSARLEPEPRYGTLRLWKARRHGDIVLALYRPGAPRALGDEGDERVEE